MKASDAKPGVYNRGNAGCRNQDRPVISQEKGHNQRKLVTQSKGSTTEKEDDRQGRIKSETRIRKKILDRLEEDLRIGNPSRSGSSGCRGYQRHQAPYRVREPGGVKRA